MTSRGDDGAAASTRVDRMVALGLFVYALGTLGLLVASGVRLTQDDGFYYFKIAQNLASGRGSTFDGVHPTNGYHPLWLLCLAVIFRLQPDPGRALLLGIALQTLLAALTVALVYLTARTSLGRLGAAGAAALWFGFTYPVALSGVEFSLQALLLVGAAWLYARHFRGQPPGVRMAALLGVVLALLFLARLDTALLALAVGGTLTVRWWRTRTSSASGRILALWAPLACVALAYAVVNLRAFGQVLPVSGMVKRSWSAYLLAQDPLYASAGWLTAKLWHLLWPLRYPGGWPLRAVFIGAFGTLLLAVPARRGGPGLVRHCAVHGLRPWAPFAVYGLLQYLLYTAVYHGPYSFTRWYYVAQPMTAALLLGAAVDWAALGAPGAPRGRWSPTALRALAAAGCCIVPLMTLRGMERLRQQQHAFRAGPLHRAAAWARGHLPADARIGTWNAGTIGYLSGRQVVNLDGLVNTQEYFRSAQYDLCAYWDRVGISHVVDVFEPGSSRMTGVTLPVTAFYSGCADRLELLWQDGEPGDPGWPKAFRLRPRVAAP